MCKISVIIPVKNEENKIENCLKSVFNQSYKPFEVIVVDGRSYDNTVEIASKYPVKIFYEDYHTRAGANNVGIQNSQGEYIAFTDADCIQDKYWLENLIKEFDETIVGVGGGILNTGSGIWEKSINFSLGTFFGSGGSIQGIFFPERRLVRSISGCNSMYRKEDLIKIGGFNVNLPTAEDTELNKRLLPMGNLIYTPNATVLHNPTRGVKEFGKRMYQYGYGKSKARLWGTQAILPILVPILFLSVFITPWILLGAAICYLTILFIMGLKFSIQEKNIQFLVTVPVVYIIEHLLYSIGFWRGL